MKDKRYECEETRDLCGWQRCVLSDFTSIVMGQSPSSKTYNQNGDGLPFFQGKGEFDDIYPTINMYCSQPKKIAKQGAVILSVRAPVGPTNLVQHECCIGRGLVALHPCGGIQPKFLLYLLRSIEPVISGKGMGSTFKAITKNFVENLEFNLPPLSEQHRIVAKTEDLFSELEKGVERLKTARTKLNFYRQSVLKHAFEGTLTSQWREENKDKLKTANKLLERIKSEWDTRYDHQLKEWKVAIREWHEGGKLGKKPRRPNKPQEITDITDNAITKPSRLPEGWATTKIGSVYIVIGGGTPSTSNDDYWGGDIPWVTSADISGIREITVSRYVTTQGIQKSATNLVPDRTLLVVTRVGLGKIAIADKPICFSQDIQGLVQDPTLILPEYTLYFLSLELQRLKFEGQGTTISGLTKKQLKDIYFPLPSFSEQNRIVAKMDENLSQINNALEKIDSQLARTKILRQSILKKAFVGQLVTQDSNDEPASVLLERIKVQREQASKKYKITKKIGKKRISA